MLFEDELLFDEKKDTLLESLLLGPDEPSVKDEVGLGF